mgnify:CR=1 FL=1
MIVQETTVGKDNRAIGLGGKDTFFGVVDGMSQCIDVISTMLYVRDVLDIAFDIETTVGALFKSGYAYRRFLRSGGHGS